MKAVMKARSMVLALGMTFLLGEAAGQGVQNIIANPSFESGLSGWNASVWGGAAATFSASGDYAQDGSQAAKCVVTVPMPDDPGKVYLRKQELRVYPGNEYLLSFHVLSNSGNTESIDVSLYSHTNIGSAAWGIGYQNKDISFTGDGTWKRMDYEFIPEVLMGTPDFNKIALNFGLGKNATTIYVDSVSLKPKNEIVIGGNNIHVSKTGDDANDGSAESPYLTIAVAAALAGPGDTVHIHEGTYEETLHPASSGTEEHPIVFQSFGNDKVIITAMQVVNGWTVDEGSVFKTSVDWDLGQDNFIMHEKTACDLARWPNNTDGDPFTLNSLRNDGGSGEDVITDAYLTDAEIPDLDWENGGSLFFYGDKPGGGWTAWKIFIKNSTAGRVEFDLEKNPSWIRTAHAPADKGDYFLEGIKAALDYDNEWYFDANSNMLYIQIPGGAMPEDSTVQMRRRKLTIDLNNRNYIKIKNLAVFGGGIEIDGSNNVLYGVSSFYGSMTRGVVSGFSSGARSVYIKGGSNNKIERCEIAYGSGSGIWDSGASSDILDCRIHDFNMLGCYDAPLMVRGQNNAIVRNNTVFRGGRDALQITGKYSEVAYNDFYESNLIADDCALLYTIGKGLNMKIHHNWFHDTEARGSKYKAAGIYLDNDAADVEVYNNVVWNTEWSAIQINWNGTNIDIFNNTLWDASKAMGAWHKDGTAFSDVNVWNNLTNMNSLEPQSDKQNNLILESDANPFSNKDQYDFIPKEHSLAVDYGREIAGYTEGFSGAAPDAGAYERGGSSWKPGITWDPALGPAGNGCYGLPGNDCDSDSDGDGVTDYLDLCPNTPAGSIVNGNGCIDRPDDDADGFHNDEDNCPNTPEGAWVDDYGCLLDRDKDGVADYIDLCLDTPSGYAVDEDGCTLDTDGDGINDNDDACPDTPADVAVDEHGCPLDTDSDGVVDYIDQCPDTPVEAEVDTVGCPLDTDEDGVPDYMDDCPDTEAGVEVDSKGCQLVGIENGVDQKLELYPNPAGNTIYIKGAESGTSYMIYNETGKLVLNGIFKTSTTRIDLSAVPEGLYIIRIGSSQQLRFVKQ